MRHGSPLWRRNPVRCTRTSKAGNLYLTTPARARRDPEARLWGRSRPAELEPCAQVTPQRFVQNSQVIGALNAHSGVSAVHLRARNAEISVSASVIGWPSRRTSAVVIPCMRAAARGWDIRHRPAKCGPSSPQALPGSQWYSTTETLTNSAVCGSFPVVSVSRERSAQRSHGAQHGPE